MIQKAVTAIGGIDTLGAISVCLFFVVFAGAILWTLSREKSFLAVMEAVPLDDGECAPARKGESSHD
ncbi:MAG TPA: hypothetical protein VHH73_12985 [Verrucomicrobiae bacterium]|nr:hypothetical protein [Verrucomicrobiae bacterium]